jgi:hypothetical protein
MSHEVLLPNAQVVVMAIGTLVPLVTYVLNHYAPWVDEKVKGVVTVVVAAIAAGLYQAIELNDFGANDHTLQLVLSAIVAALTAHHWFYRPSGINVALGGGTNAQTDKPVSDPAR